MKTRLLWFSLLAAGLLSGAETFSLDDAVMIALKQNSSILQAKNNTEINDNLASAGNAGLLPALILGASSQYSSTDFAGIATQQTTTQAGVSLSQTLFSGFGNYYQYKILQNKSDVARWRERQTIENILLEISTNWYRLLAASDNVAITRGTLDISKERYRRSETDFSFGNSSKLNYLNAKVDLNSDSLSYLSALETYRDEQRSFCRLLGIDPATELNPLITDTEFHTFDKEGLIEALTTLNSNYMLSEMSVSGAEYAVKTALSSWSPSITLSGSYGLAGTNNSSSFSYNHTASTASAGLNLSVTLFSGGKRKAQVENARITVRNSTLQSEDVSLELRRSLESALSNYNTNLQKLATQKTSLEAAQLNFDQSAELFRLGQLTSTQFREAQLNLLNSRMILNQARYSAKSNELQILWLTGSIIEYFTDGEAA